jgi:hypothetical protein
MYYGCLGNAYVIHRMGKYLICPTTKNETQSLVIFLGFLGNHCLHLGIVCIIHSLCWVESFWF